MKSFPELPLTAAVFHILLALADGEKHGYAIMREVELHAERGLRIGPGTLYGSLDRLLAAQWIAECAPPRSKRNEDARRRYYRLTTLGMKVLRAESERLAQSIATARQKGVLPELRAAKS